MNTRIGVWPAIGIAPGILDIENFVGNSILKRFPPGFINSYHFDEKIGYRTQYKTTRKNLLKNSIRGEFTQQHKPRLTVIFENRDTKQEEAAGGIEQPWTYPLVQGVQPEMHGYEPIYADKDGIKIYIAHKRVRYTFSGIIECETLGDQENTLIYMENLFKIQYGTFLENFFANFLLPNSMMDTMYKLKYHEDLVKIYHGSDFEYDERKEALARINEHFYNELRQYSNLHGISHFFRNEKSNDVFYKYKRWYQKMYFEINDPPQKTDGEKLGSVYSKYTVTFGGFFEFEKPNAYLLTCPNIVKGVEVTEILENTGDLKELLSDHNPDTYMKFFKRQLHIPKEIMKLMKPEWGYSIIWTDTDISLDSPSDYIDIVDWMCNSKDQSFKPYGAYISTLTKDEFVEKFVVIMYNTSTGHRVDNNDLFWDGEILHIGNTTPGCLYTIYLLGKRGEINSEIEKLTNKVEDCRGCSNNREQ